MAFLTSAGCLGRRELQTRSRRARQTDRNLKAVAARQWKCVIAPNRASDYVTLAEDFDEIVSRNTQRQSKLVCTIGPKTCTKEMMLKLAETGMNVVRLNMSHGTHEWHQNVIDLVKEINSEGVHNLGLLLDTKGPEVRSGDLKEPIVVERGQEFVWTVRKNIPARMGKFITEVSYDDFVNDVHVGDTLLVDGGICSFSIKEVTDVDVVTECIDGGTLTSRRHLNVRGKSASLPAITDKDWEDIKFGMKNGVDFYALSFVKHPKDVQELIKHLRENGDDALVLSKIESAESIGVLHEILEASDGAMVARGDLGSEIPFEDVPLIQEEIVKFNRSLKKPTIVATHMLESMIQYPTPTRAEVTDIQKALQQGADATMLSGETAGGNFPLEAVDVMATVSRSVFGAIIEEEYVEPAPVAGIDSERASIAYTASVLAKKLSAAAIVCFTRQGSYPKEVSSTRPHTPIIAFCPRDQEGLVRTLSLYWGVRAYPLDFNSDPEETISSAIAVLKECGIVKPKDHVVFTSDVLVPSTSSTVNTIQVRMIN
eukprot:Plantae.Rhodophyta-Purpureofilum_apyrenoidigerum.ctg7088.p1 GENE.Plantae.Rhodophyta-Purpureofilum_apyrenoidigerum.ctg7088~~Plantae.Rhodophyta-Purpureofilum_apyrenoidigerum.ctg7088.p1  ORF type:complete len:590 (-),score=120.77 Plantae.Rhodophyta-Purpureofilum_apyrenoidigerum.ctg7088:124-1746(-)